MNRPELEARSAAFGVSIMHLCGSLQGVALLRNAINQLLDSSTAIGANYRASSRARSKREFVAKLGVVAEEADEAVYWLEHIRQAGCGDADTIKELLAEATELRSIFAASYRTARGRNKRHGDDHHDG